MIKPLVMRPKQTSKPARSQQSPASHGGSNRAPSHQDSSQHPSQPSSRKQILDSRLKNSIAERQKYLVIENSPDSDLQDVAQKQGQRIERQIGRLQSMIKDENVK